MTLLVLLLLKTFPSPESSSSEGEIRTPLPLSRGARMRLAATTSGTIAIGGGELGVWREWGELDVWAVCGVGDGGGLDSVMGVLEAPAFADVALGEPSRS